MINPGGSPGTSFSKSAQTRFNNNQINGQRATMPFNMAAQQALRNMKSGAKPGGPPVAPVADPNGNVPSQVQQQPVGQMQTPMQQDPAMIQENIVNELISNIRREQFINSPQVKDAMTSIRLRNIFNATNPDATPDNRDLVSRIQARIE